MKDFYRHYAFSSFSAVSPPPKPSSPVIRTVVFDLGGVLIDWNPRYLFKDVFTSAIEMEQFLAEVCSPSWNDQQDRGRSWDQAVDELVARFPDRAEQIRAYHHRWEETLGQSLPDTVDLLESLRDAGHVRLIALTNWSQEKFPIARERFPFLSWFEQIMVSGDERIAKPDAEIFNRLRDRFSLVPSETLFIDDAPRNVDAAGRLGFQTILFQSPDQLASELRNRGVLRS